MLAALQRTVDHLLRQPLDIISGKPITSGYAGSLVSVKPHVTNRGAILIINRMSFSGERHLSQTSVDPFQE